MRWSLLAFSLAACATASGPGMPDATDFAAAVRSGNLNAETFDFASAGFWTMDEGARLAWRTDAQAILRPPGPALASTCEAEDRRALAALAWSQLAAAAPTAADWRVDAAAIRTDLRRIDALLASRTDSVSDVDARESVRTLQRAMFEETDPRARELLRRVIRDQSLRFILGDDAPDHLSANARDQWTIAVGSRLTAIDCDNTNWLRQQLTEISWFDIPTYSAAADHAAWLITQHADRTPDFQRAVLARLESLPPGHTSARNLAYLTDRIATSEGRSQRYGTQMHCSEAGEMVPIGGIEDEANVDARRAGVGLQPLETYRRLMAQDHPCRERR